MAALIMVVTVVLIIVAVRYGLLAGIDHLAMALDWGPKVRGQITGLATSSPELVCLVAAGVAGVWEVGLWNIAASNIINCLLMAAAVLTYGQGRELLNRRFADEVGFSMLAIAVPLVLMSFALDTHWSVVPGLLALFWVYRIVDKRLNPASATAPPAAETVGNIQLGLILISTALVAIAVAGFFLGGASEKVVNQLGVPSAAAGWILGLVTSIPEMVTFFAVYAASRESGRLNELDDTQEVLDNLTSSNMANTGLVYPIGLGVFLLVSAVI